MLLDDAWLSVSSDDVFDDAFDLGLDSLRAWREVGREGRCNRRIPTLVRAYDLLRFDDLSINGKFVEITDDKTAIPEFYKLRSLESDIDGLIDEVTNIIIKLSAIQWYLENY